MSGYSATFETVASTNNNYPPLHPTTTTTRFWRKWRYKKAGSSSIEKRKALLPVHRPCCGTFLSPSRHHLFFFRSFFFLEFYLCHKKMKEEKEKKECLAQPLGFSHLAPPSTGQFHLKYHGSVVSSAFSSSPTLFFFGNEKQSCPLDGQQTPSLASCWRNKEETDGAHKGEKRKMPMSCSPWHIDETFFGIENDDTRRRRGVRAHLAPLTWKIGQKWITRRRKQKTIGGYLWRSSCLTFFPIAARVTPPEALLLWYFSIFPVPENK